MRNTKILKARCKKTGRWSALELKQVGGDWRVINMIPLTADEASLLSSEIRQPVFQSHTSLLACSRCGNRKVSGCGCLSKRISCKADMPYQYECMYCPEFQIEYARGKKNPYTKWAGISNIPDAIRDSYGNPLGSQYDLAEDGGFDGFKILIVNPVREIAPTAEVTCVCEALKSKGFDVTVVSRMPSPNELRELLRGQSQLWLTSRQDRIINDAHTDIIQEFFRAGHGVYIWGDNDPLNDTANFVIGKLFGASMCGDYKADKVLSIQKKKGGAGIIADHLISTGIESFYEGITIAHIKLSGGLEPLVYSSDRNIVTAFYDHNGRRALVDGAFTRLWDFGWGKSAGTGRYIVNAAAWLANVERFDSSDEASQFGSY